MLEMYVLQAGLLQGLEAGGVFAAEAQKSTASRQVLCLPFVVGRDCSVSGKAQLSIVMTCVELVNTVTVNTAGIGILHDSMACP